MVKTSDSLKEKGGRAGKQRQLGTDETNNVAKKPRIDLPDGENDGIISKRNAPVGNRIKMAISMAKKD